MPLIKSAIKRARQTTKRRERNVATKRNLKAAVKSLFAKPSAATLSEAQSELDTMVKKNLLSKNTAARRKSSLSKKAKEAGVKLETAKPSAAKSKAPAKKATTAKTAAKKSAPQKKAAK